MSIRDLSPVEFASTTDRIPIYRVNQGDNRSMTVGVLFNYIQSQVDAAALDGTLIRQALDAQGSLVVRYDAAQPEIDCLWVAPDGSVVLITGS